MEDAHCNSKSMMVMLDSFIGPYQFKSKLMIVQLVTLKLCDDNRTRYSLTKPNFLYTYKNNRPRNLSSPFTYLK